MNITNIRADLLFLSQPPNGGKERLETDITFTGSDMVETHLGSIPADYEIYSGREKRELISFRGDRRVEGNPPSRNFRLVVVQDGEEKAS